MTTAPFHNAITIFLCGDVMTGRGIDQILPQPSIPEIHESYMKDARGYLLLAERASGEIPRPAPFAYPWGEALAIFETMAPELKIINLETSITISEDYWPGKGINYRMHPGNIRCLTEAGIDACTLANNHVLDWGYRGLEETLATLQGAGIKTAGAGCDLQQAAAPAELVVPGKGRVLVFSFGMESSGIPKKWCAAEKKGGVHCLADLSAASVAQLAAQLSRVKVAGDVVFFSIHWGGNWGYQISQEQRNFAHGLIDQAGVDIVHGHSSHHVMGIEIYHGRPIIYGCGDFINDYEGISGYGTFRGDLGLMYFPTVEAGTGRLLELVMVPTRLRRFRVERASQGETEWLAGVLNREGRRLGSSARLREDGKLVLQASQGAAS